MNERRPNEVELEDFTQHPEAYTSSLSDSSLVATINGEPAIIMLAPASFDELNRQNADLAQKLAQANEHLEFLHTCEAVRQGLEDARAGRTISVEELDRKMKEKYPFLRKT